MAWSIFSQGGGNAAATAWAEAFLKKLGAPQTPQNVQFVYQWEKAEGGGGAFNPLNQGPVPGHPELTTTGSQYGGGAADFAGWDAGLQGAVDYLHMNLYSGVLNDLMAGTTPPQTTAAALWASPWAASHYGNGSHWPSVAPAADGTVPPQLAALAAGAPPGAAAGVAGGGGVPGGVYTGGATAQPAGFLPDLNPVDWMKALLGFIAKPFEIAALRFLIGIAGVVLVIAGLTVMAHTGENEVGRAEDGGSSEPSPQPAAQPVVQPASSSKGGRSERGGPSRGGESGGNISKGMAGEAEDAAAVMA